MCEQTYSESGALAYIRGCKEFNLIFSDRDRLADVVKGLEEQSFREAEKLLKEQIENERLRQERDALLKVREAADVLAKEVYDHTDDEHYLRVVLEAYKEARDG